MNRIIKGFKKLTAYDHFLVFLIILSLLKVINIFSNEGLTSVIHFLKLGIPLFVISSSLFFIFKYITKKKKKYKHALISTFLILLMLSHADPDPIRGILVIVLLYVSKFFITYQGQTIFNPVVFAIGMSTIIAWIIPIVAVPPLDFSGIDIRFSIANKLVPFALIPIILSLIFNVARIKKHPLAISYIVTSLIGGFMISAYTESPFSYVLTIAFMGVAIIVEPKTAPHKIKDQWVFGISLALITLFFQMIKVPNAVVVTLMMANILYFVIQQQRKLVTKKIIK
jgi:hypothetical protein